MLHSRTDGLAEGCKASCAGYRLAEVAFTHRPSAIGGRALTIRDRIERPLQSFSTRPERPVGGELRGFGQADIPGVPWCPPVSAMVQ
jgi:hypothetical protein